MRMTGIAPGALTGCLVSVTFAAIAFPRHGRTDIIPLPEIVRSLPHADIGAMTAADMARGFADGRLTPSDVCSAFIARIDAANAIFRPVLFVDRDGAARAAAASDARWRAGVPIGPLDGVPVSLKLHMRAKGMPTMMGCGPASRLDFHDDADEPAVALLRAAGAVLTGKTLSPDNPYVATSLNRVFGTCLNPWNLDRTAGGSSSGAAAAAAARLGPIHLGSDGGGSVRLPASYCGAIGIKPSFGIVPDEEQEPFRAGAYGPIGLDMADMLSALQVLAPSIFSGFHVSPAVVSGARVGVCRWIGGDAKRPSTAVTALLDRAAGVIADAGATIVDVAPFMPDGWWLDLVRGVVATYAQDARAGFSDPEYAALAPEFRLLIESMGRLSDADRASLNARWQQRDVPDPLRGLDVLLLATTPDVAHAADLSWPADVEPDPFNHIAMPHVAQTGFFNFRDYPAGTLPMGFVEGLPAGLQVVAARGGDRQMMQWMLAIEQLFRERLWQ
jgi:aspartyl-tRNA(Asn)/glutamyl-tRNA(Gln) amidotransferase subunit A